MNKVADRLNEIAEARYAGVAKPLTMLVVENERLRAEIAEYKRREAVERRWKVDRQREAVFYEMGRQAADGMRHGLPNLMGMRAQLCVLGGVPDYLKDLGAGAGRADTSRVIPPGGITAREG